jgi:hypothetical protein
MSSDVRTCDGMAHLDKGFELIAELTGQSAERLDGA